MVGLLGDRAEAGNELLADRHGIQVPVLAGIGGGAAGIPGVGALQKVEPADIDEAADTDRGLGARDQKRAREAAADDRLTWYRFGAQRRDKFSASVYRPERVGRCGAGVVPDRPARRHSLEEDTLAMRLRQLDYRSPQRCRCHASI